MNAINVRKYKPKNIVLRNLIKYYWIISSNKEVCINNKLIPSNNIDFILNFSSPINYINNKNIESFERFHFSGIRNKYQIIQQKGILDVLGISFFPTGVHSILKVPLSEFSDKTILLDDLFDKFDSKFNCIKESTSDFDKIDKLEKILLQMIDFRLIPKEVYTNFIDKVYRSEGNFKVQDYCNHFGINQRTFERNFKTMVGINPKSFIKLTRFQLAANQLINKSYNNLTSLSYNLDYFDQTHFIKDFKSFMQVTPLEFIKQKNSVKELLELRYLSIFYYFLLFSEYIFAFIKF